MNVDTALKMQPPPDECECPECGGPMMRSQDAIGEFYVCCGDKGEFDCGTIEIEYIGHRPWSLMLRSLLGH